MEFIFTERENNWSEFGEKFVVRGLADVCFLLQRGKSSSLEKVKKKRGWALPFRIFRFVCFVWFYMFLSQSGSLYFFIFSSLISLFVSLYLLCSSPKNVMSKPPHYSFLFKGPKPYKAVEMEKLMTCNTTDILITFFFLHYNILSVHYSNFPLQFLMKYLC